MNSADARPGRPTTSCTRVSPRPVTVATDTALSGWAADEQHRSGADAHRGEVGEAREAPAGDEPPLAVAARHPAEHEEHRDLQAGRDAERDAAPDDVEAELLGHEEGQRRHRRGVRRHEQHEGHDEQRDTGTAHGVDEAVPRAGGGRPRRRAGPLADHRPGHRHAHDGDPGDRPEDGAVPEQAHEERREGRSGDPREGEHRAGPHDLGNPGARGALVREEQPDADAGRSTERHEGQDGGRQRGRQGQRRREGDGEAPRTRASARGSRRSGRRASARRAWRRSR